MNGLINKTSCCFIVEDMLEVTCNGDVTDNIKIVYRKSNYEDEWYMITVDGMAIKWDNEGTLNTLAAPIVEYVAILYLHGYFIIRLIYGVVF